MNKTRLVFGLSLFVIVSCVGSSPKVYSEAEILEICKLEKRNAQAPVTNVSVGTGSKGTNFAIQVLLSDKYLAGKDPEIVYENCISRISALAN